MVLGVCIRGDNMAQPKPPKALPRLVVTQLESASHPSNSGSVNASNLCSTFVQSVAL